MTTQELIDYYKNLLILQYKGKEKNDDCIEALVALVVASQIYTDVQNAFDLETAVGVQLDVLGKYAGVSRYTYDFTDPIVLDDDEFRVMIKAAIARNNFGSSLYDIQSILWQFFPGTLLVIDYANMRMSYLFDSSLGSIQLAEAFVVNGLLPKPMGVELAALIYGPGVDNFFGFQTYTSQSFANHGFNTYDNYETDCPFLSYDNAIFVI